MMTLCIDESKRISTFSFKGVTYWSVLVVQPMPSQKQTGSQHVMFVPTVKMEFVATTDVTRFSAFLLNITAKN